MSAFEELFHRYFLGSLEARVLMVQINADSNYKAILYKLHLGETVVTIPPIVEAVQYKNYIGGQDQIRALWRHHYHRCQAIIFVVDSYDGGRLDEAWREMGFLLQQGTLRHAAVFVLDSMQDLPRSMTPRLGWLAPVLHGLGHLTPPLANGWCEVTASA